MLLQERELEQRLQDEEALGVQGSVPAALYEDMQDPTEA